MLFKTLHGPPVQILKEELEIYPDSLLSAMYRFYEYNTEPIVIFNISDEQLTILSKIYKKQPIPNNSYYKYKSLYEFVDADAVYDLLDYFMIPLEGVLFEVEADDAPTEVHTEVSDDFVANWPESEDEVEDGDEDSDWSVDEGTWD